MRMGSASVVTELALSAVRAVERELGRFVVGGVGRPAMLVERKPRPPALGALGGQSDAHRKVHESRCVKGLKRGSDRGGVTLMRVNWRNPFDRQRVTRYSMTRAPAREWKWPR